MIWTAKRIIASLEWAQRQVAWSAVFLVVVGVIFSFSTFLYGSFYYLYMPRQTYEVPIEFLFDPCTPEQQNAHGRSKCSFPMAAVAMPDLRDEEGERSYEISVDMDVSLPEGKASRTHTFIVCLNVGNKEICKPVRLTSKSRYARFLDFIATYPLELLTRLLVDGSITEATDETQFRMVVFYKTYRPGGGEAAPSVANVTIKDVHVDIVAANFNIHLSDLRGLQYMMWYHPRSTKIMSVLSLSFFLLLGTMYFWQWLTRPKTVISVTRLPRSESADSIYGRYEAARLKLARARNGSVQEFKTSPDEREEAYEDGDAGDTKKHD